MIDLIKKKAGAMLISAAAVLTAVQIILPTLADLILGSVIVALVWAATKI